MPSPTSSSSNKKNATASSSSAGKGRSSSSSSSNNNNNNNNKAGGVSSTRNSSSSGKQKVVGSSSSNVVTTSGGGDLNNSKDSTDPTTEGGSITTSTGLQQQHDNKHSHKHGNNKNNKNSKDNHNNTKSISTSGVMEYLQVALPRKTLLSLYMEEERGQYVCRAVLQQLPPLSQQIIIRLSCTGGTFPLSGIRIWTSISNLQTIYALLREMYKWAIIQDFNPTTATTVSNTTTGSSGSTTTTNNNDSKNKNKDNTTLDDDYNISLTIPFAKGLQKSMRCLDSSPWVPLTPVQMDALVVQQQQLVNNNNNNNNNNADHPGSTATPIKGIKVPSLPTPEDLERYTQLQWDSVLHFLVGTVGQKEPAPAVVHFLLQTGLMQPDPDYNYNNNNSNNNNNNNNTKGSSSKGSGSGGTGSSTRNKVNNNNNDDDAPLVITTKGYEFMLQDNYQQVWHFIVQYLHSIEEHAKGEELLKEALLLLICLTYSRVGCPYLANTSLKKDCRTMIKDLALFGLLYTTKIGKLTIFYPTRLAMQMVGTSSSSSSSSSSRTTITTSNTCNTSSTGSSTLWSLSSKTLESSLVQPDPTGSSHLAIIVQTNFQLAAYTVNELHISMLGLFCDIGTIRKLPNVVFMQITRDSVKSAFALGIKAKQILRFLEKHIHPRLRSGGNSNNSSTLLYDSPIPSNVVDQIWLWDRESSRVIFTKVYQHQCIMGIDEYKAVLQYSIDKGVHAYSSERRQQLLLDYNYIDRIQAFVRQWRAQHVSRYNNK